MSDIADMAEIAASPPPQRDWLLTSARVLVTICRILVITVGLILIAAMIGILFQQADVMHQLVEQRVGVPTWQVLTAFELAIGFIVAMIACAQDWLKQLQRLIGSVSDGDPFAPVNAERLTRMGWLTVAIQLLAIPVGGIGHWLESAVKEATHDFGISLGGFLLALVLFILARVFRHGTTLRAELEGTV